MFYSLLKMCFFIVNRTQVSHKHTRTFILPFFTPFCLASRAMLFAVTSRLRSKRVGSQNRRRRT